VLSSIDIDFSANGAADRWAGVFMTFAWHGPLGALPILWSSVVRTMRSLSSSRPKAGLVGIAVERCTASGATGS
jgi:hypothetical protein